MDAQRKLIGYLFARRNRRGDKDGWRKRIRREIRVARRLDVDLQS